VVPFGAGGPATNMYSTFSSATGTGGVGTPGGNFGSRYQWYVDAVRRRISENWLKYEVDPRISNANRVYVTFDILRDGSPSNVQLAQSSGVPSLDQSAVRAVERIDRFNPLPPDYNGSRVSVEFYFEYKK
jgi:protein TonB